MKGFGASDCGCASHLFFFESRPSLVAFRRRIRATVPGHDRIKRADGWMAG
jgi:Uri superfamily endonuclease